MFIRSMGGRERGGELAVLLKQTHKKKRYNLLGKETEV